MNLLREIWKWGVYSSANPQNLALTLKAGVAVLILLGLDKVSGDLLVNNLIGTLVSLVQTISYAGLVWGGVRKVGLTLNQKLNIGF